MNDAPREVAHSVVRSMHPMLIVAAGAVTVFCAVGIGVMTGIIPSAQGQKNEPAAASTSAAPVSPTATADAAKTADAAVPESRATDLKPAENSTIGQPLAKPEKSAAATAAHKTAPATHVAKAASNGSREEPTPVYAQGSKNAADSQPTRVAAYEPPPICHNCGTIDSITPITKQGEGSGAGAVLGGVLGGVLGHQVGNGRGKDLATVAGAVGGAVLGNTVEKNAKTSSAFDVRVRLEDGTFQTLRYETDPGMRVGDKVKIENGRAVRS
jgi:outer membrane lipoprotein SlyB